MDLSSRMHANFGWLGTSIIFFKNNFSRIITLALVAAFGRAIQLGAFGTIGFALNVTLEVMVESCRLLIFFYTLGLTNFKTGFWRFIQFFTEKMKRKEYWDVAIKTLKINWFKVVLNLVAFIILTSVINYLINLAAYETCMFYKLKAGKIISETASVWVLLLFFKNISVIPLTLIFNAVFLLWITRKLVIPTKRPTAS